LYRSWCLSVGVSTNGPKMSHPVTIAGRSLALSEPGSQGGGTTQRGILWMTFYTSTTKFVGKKSCWSQAGAMFAAHSLPRGDSVLTSAHIPIHNLLHSPTLPAFRCVDQLLEKSHFGFRPCCWLGSPSRHVNRKFSDLLFFG
jgi:hypothetical protein